MRRLDVDFILLSAGGAFEGGMHRCDVGPKAYRLGSGEAAWDFLRHFPRSGPLEQMIKK